MGDGYTVAVVGAGLVGDRLVSELRRRDFPMKELRVLARSARTAVTGGRTTRTARFKATRASGRG